MYLVKISLQFLINTTLVTAFLQALDSHIIK